MELGKKNIGNGSILLELREELDLYSAPDFRKNIEALFNLHQPQGIILSLKELEYIDSSGVGVLLSLVRKCQQLHCHLLFCEIGRQCREVIQMTQLHRVFRIVDSEYEALKQMNDHLGSLQDKPVDGPILVDDRHPHFDTSGMHHKAVNIDFQRIRYISHVITQSAPDSIKEYNLLEQQVSEIVKNAVRHGNRNDITKEVKIWWKFTPEEAHLIVEDQGPGFRNVDEWNHFYKKRMECFLQGNPEDMMDYLSYRTEDSVPDDGGNALFAAIEYWNGGYVLNGKKNAVALKRKFI